MHTHAGIMVLFSDARIIDDAKPELLTHLRRSHGSEAYGDGAPRRITLKRKTQSELKLASVQGRARTVNVEVRRKRSEEHTSELQSPMYLVCRLLLEKKK